MSILALTMGEPAGVGGEFTLRSWQSLRATGPAFVALDDPDRLREIAATRGWDVKLRPVADPREATACFGDALPVLPVPLAVPAIAGQPDTANAPAVIASIDRAIDLATTVRVAGIVTNPIQKATLYAAGFQHPGHTEYLAARAGGMKVAMMLACPSLRVVPVTIHLALKSAVAGLRRDFAIASPRIAVAGLNPHAGEQGAMGREDIDVVAPAIATLRGLGIDAAGPLPPDTMFSPRARIRYDAAICMYHDQALIPLKTLDVDGGVNVTLGLPYVRTSPDHGTALDIAGKGLADPGSLIAALKLAAELAANRALPETIQ
jgi:4-hydroxythreonine-4-phosphate dehydrogenase